MSVSMTQSAEFAANSANGAFPIRPLTSVPTTCKFSNLTVNHSITHLQDHKEGRRSRRLPSLLEKEKTMNSGQELRFYSYLSH